MLITFYTVMLIIAIINLLDHLCDFGVLSWIIITLFFLCSLTVSKHAKQQVSCQAFILIYYIL